MNAIILTRVYFSRWMGRTHLTSGFQSILGRLLRELTMIHKSYKAGSLGQSNSGQKLEQTLGKAYYLRKLVS